MLLYLLYCEAVSTSLVLYSFFLMFTCNIFVLSCVCFLQLYKDQSRNSENISHKSSDSDVSDVSAISRTSSASRISSTSYMSIQSERPRGRFRYTHFLVLHVLSVTMTLLMFCKSWPTAELCVHQAATWWRAPAWVVRSTARSTPTAASRTRRSGAWGVGSKSGVPAWANVLLPSCHQDGAGVPPSWARQVRDKTELDPSLPLLKGNRDEQTMRYILQRSVSSLINMLLKKSHHILLYLTKVYFQKSDASSVTKSSYSISVLQHF